VSTDPESLRKAHQRIVAWRRPLLAGLPGDWSASKALRRQVTEALSDVYVATVARLKPDLVVEVGAYEATTSMQVRRAWPQARAIAFEAHRDIVAREAGMIVHAGVDYVHALVGEVEGPRRLFVPLEQGRPRLRMGSALADTQAEGSIELEAPGITLDGYFADEPDATSALWIDAEGSSGLVLQGGARMLDRCLLLMAEVETRQRWAGEKLEDEIVAEAARHGLIPIASDIQTPWQFSLLFARADQIDPALRAAVAAYERTAESAVGQAPGQPAAQAPDETASDIAALIAPRTAAKAATGRAAVILAAGQGTRMKSPLPKVLHAVAHRAMLDHAIDAAEALGCEKVVVVAGTHSPAVGERVRARLGDQAIAIQDPPLGTGHAVLAAREALAGFQGDVVVSYADCPLLEAADIAPLFELRRAGVDVAVLGFEAANPGAYGRLVLGPYGSLDRIVEARDADAAESALTLCNSGVLACDAGRLFELLGKVGANNAKGEYYLTDVVGLARAAGLSAKVAVASEAAVMGVNSQTELAQAEALFQARRRGELMAAGVSMTAPDTVHLAYDTSIGAGVTVEPYVVFGPEVEVEGGAVIRAFSHLEGALVRKGAVIGPYARLRPGADIGEAAHIGNFVEVKKVKVGAGAKANHLSYLGDGTVGAKANIGAGTIFCNYDGFDKFQTHVGEGAFIGSDTALVAPVTIGAGAFTGSGSVITHDVSPDALALARGRQVEKPGWAEQFRLMKRKQKARP
jgi:bifunctional UDP-N-acetylglucosamine pyrophosphorylase/glucosamine-1-phosphate N-acetyltransferase